MNITELKEGQGIIFKTEEEKERILPVLHFLGFTNLHITSAIAMSKMTGALLYVNIEADKKLTYSTAQNFKVNYTFSLNITIPPGVQLDMQLAELKPFVAHVGGFIRNDAAFDKAWDSIFNKPKFRTGGLTWEPFTKPEYPPYLYDITPQDALTLISFLDPNGKVEFKDKWGDNILDGKPIVATGLTKQKYLNHCRNKFRDEANKLFKMQCPYKDMELILVKHYESNDWMPRFFYKVDSVEGVWVHGQSSTTPILYKIHCKAKVIPA